MSDTYTGWDGNPYPWPPPDGWYEASDGRWWAPGTGPTPPPGAASTPPAQAAPPTQVSQAQPPQTPAPQTQAQPPQTQAPQTQAPSAFPPPGADPGRTAQLPTFGAAAGGQAPGQGAIDAGVTTPAQASRGAASTTAFSGGPPPGASDPSGQWDPQASQATPAPAPSGRGRGGRILLGLVGVIAALAVAGAGYFFLRDTDATNDETAATEDSAAEGESTTTSAAGDDAAGSGDEPASTVEGEDGTVPTESTTADGDADETTTTEAEETSSSSEAETTVTSEDDTTTTADPNTQVAMFRDILTVNGLTSDGLSDAEIASFGTQFCIFATASENETEYVEFRQEAISETQSDLDPDELFLVIDAAVVVFCPDQANRLGISV